jgi:hypothetical protein
MFAQSLVVALVVASCTVYAAWRLLPAAARRGIATALLGLPLPEGIARFMRKHSVAAGGCACEGCDHAAPKPESGVHVIVFQRRPGR